MMIALCCGTSRQLGAAVKMDEKLAKMNEICPWDDFDTETRKASCKVNDTLSVSKCVFTRLEVEFFMQMFHVEFCTRTNVDCLMWYALRRKFQPTRHPQNMRDGESETN